MDESTKQKLTDALSNDKSEKEIFDIEYEEEVVEAWLEFCETYMDDEFGDGFMDMSSFSNYNPTKSFLKKAVGTAVIAGVAATLGLPSANAAMINDHIVQASPTYSMMI